MLERDMLSLGKIQLDESEGRVDRTLKISAPPGRRR